MFGRKYQRDKRKKLLNEIYEAGGTLMVMFQKPGKAPLVLQKYMDENNVTNPELKRSIKAMSSDGLISMKEFEGVITIKLRKEGKVKALKYRIDEMELKRPKKWDKKWRMVMFDVPERKKLARDILTTKLNELGFKRIQNSAYIFPYPCEDEIEFIASVYEIRPYVQVLRVDKISNSERLITHFKL